MTKSISVITLALFLASCTGGSKVAVAPQIQDDVIHSDPVMHMNSQSRWVDAMMATLTPRERIAQLFMVAGYSNREPAHADSLERLVREVGIGGVVWFQGGPKRQSTIANRLQNAAKVPLLFAMDAEWGIGMRLDSTTSFPYQMSLGAIPDESLIEEMGKQIATDFRRLGMHVNFAPVADVNNNPANPVISYRSFGEDRSNVAIKAMAYADGLQTNGIMTSGKHFPGHGDTDVDSHYALPLIKHDRNRLDSLELYPFKRMLDNGLAGVMIAHLSIPSLDDTPNLPSTLSEPIVTGILRNQLGFRGLVFSDAMNMKGVTDHFPTGEAEVRALLAGNDILELTPNIPKAIDAIEAAIREGRITQEYIDAKVRKVLAAKQWSGLDKWRPVDLDNMTADLNGETSRRLNRQLAANFVTLARHQTNILPLKPANRVAVLSIGPTERSPFQMGLGDGFYPYWISWQTSEAMADAVAEALKGYDQVVIALHDVRRRPLNRLVIPEWIQRLIAEQSQLPNRALVLFSNPYTWLQVEGADNFGTLVFAYENTEFSQAAAADILLGNKPAVGRLPVSLSPNLTYGTNVRIQ
jgi:beta-N-acetylhexosaminidase